MVLALRPPAVLAAAAVVLALVLAGCSSDEEAPGPAAPAPSTTTPPSPTEAVREVPTTATVRQVTGRLSPEVREHVRRRVVETVDAWMDAAYVDGDYPRSDFDDAFTTFTTGAAARARGDLDLMTNAGVGASVDAVRVRARELKIDVLAHDGHAAAVTVAFRLGLALRGDIERNDRVRGRLLLTYAPGGWRIFGYDVERGEV